MKKKKTNFLLNPHDSFCCPLQENTTSDIITNLTPGAQYRVVVYHTNGPLISPPSEPVIIDIGTHPSMFLLKGGRRNVPVCFKAFQPAVLKKKSFIDWLKSDLKGSLVPKNVSSDCECSEPTGVRELVVYPLSPTAVILSWQRPYNVAFRKYVLQTFYFNSATQTAQWTTYYEIAATASVIASVVNTQYAYLVFWAGERTVVLGNQNLDLGFSE